MAALEGMPRAVAPAAPAAPAQTPSPFISEFGAFNLGAQAEHVINEAIDGDWLDQPGGCEPTVSARPANVRGRGSSSLGYTASALLTCCMLHLSRTGGRSRHARRRDRGPNRFGASGAALGIPTALRGVW